MNVRQIDAMKPGEVLWDDQIRGLHVRSYEDRQSFLLYYRTKDRRERRPKLGDYGVLTLAAARDLARARLGLVAAGKDPVREMAPKHTVADLIKRLIEVHGPKRKPGTVVMYGTAANHILPAIGALRVCDVTRKEIADLHHKMREIPTTANRTLAVLHKAFNLAEVWGWRPPHSNPIHGIERNKEKKRRRYPSPDEATRLFRALERYPDKVFAGLIWLLCFTGCRRNEIQTAKREWIHPDGLHLPDSKGGERIVPLSKAAREVITKIPQIKGNPYLIPGRVHGHHLVLVKKSWADLLDRAQVPRGRSNSGLQMRDLRRYFASLGLSAGLSLEAVGQLLGHTQAQTTKVYAYLLTDAATRAAEATASQLVRVRRHARSRQPRSTRVG